MEIERGVGLVWIWVFENVLEEFNVVDDVWGWMGVDGGGEEVEWLDWVVVREEIIVEELDGVEVLERWFVGNVVLRMMWMMVEMGEMSNVR